MSRTEPEGASQVRPVKFLSCGVQIVDVDGDFGQLDSDKHHCNTLMR